MFFDGTDYYTKPGAEFLKKKIYDYWKTKDGGKYYPYVKVDLVPAKFGTRTKFFIKSNIVNGYPPLGVS